MICATVVARAMWARLKPKCWPELKADEDAITTYMFADFREDQPSREEAVLQIWEKAKESVSRQQDGEAAEDSFAGICRSPGFVRAFWSDWRFQLTTSHWRAGWAYDEPHVVLGGEDLARQAVVTWDGVKPATLEEATNKLSFKKLDDQRIMTFAYFRSPLLLQVDFTPGKGSKQSLDDIQRFSANVWEFVPDPYGMKRGRWKVTGEVPYTIMAIVLHRDTKDGVDYVRLFGESGREELPVGTLQMQWPFDLDEPIPAGCKITIFYKSVSVGGEAFDPDLRPSERLPKAPLDDQTGPKAQVGLGSAGERGVIVEDADREQAEQALSGLDQSVMSGWGQLQEQIRARHKEAASDPKDDGVASSKMPAESSRASKPPPNAPTEPRADREARRSARKNDEEIRRPDSNESRRADQATGPRRSSRNTAATGANAEGISDSRLRPGESSRGGRHSGERGDRSLSRRARR